MANTQNLKPWRPGQSELVNCPTLNGSQLISLPKEQKQPNLLPGADNDQARLDSRRREKVDDAGRFVELVATWTARLRSRENSPVNVIRCQGSPFSAVRLVAEELRKMAVFRSFLGKQGREFSEFQTEWRRGRDSICA